MYSLNDIAAIDQMISILEGGGFIREKSSDRYVTFVSGTGGITRKAITCALASPQTDSFWFSLAIEVRDVVELGVPNDFLYWPSIEVELGEDECYLLGSQMMRKWTEDEMDVIEQALITIAYPWLNFYSNRENLIKHLEDALLTGVTYEDKVCKASTIASVMRFFLGGRISGAPPKMESTTFPPAYNFCLANLYFDCGNMEKARSHYLQWVKKKGFRTPPENKLYGSEV